MRFLRVILFVLAGLGLGLVSALPVQQSEGLLQKSQDLDRLVMVEADGDTVALRNKRTIGVLRTLFPDISADVNPEAENQVAAESQNNAVRVQFADEKDSSAAAANDAAQPELAPLDDVEVADDSRNKRFLFGGLGGSAGGSAGSGGGSGNFLFDIIRQTADGAARAAGTVYRVVAGTQSLGLGLSASRDISPIPLAAPAPMGMGMGMGMGMPAQPALPASSAAPAPPGAPAASSPPTAVGNATAGPGLVAGSGSTEQGDAAANAPLDPGRSTDGLQEAVPGPVTRLFVIANRGISNLIQDLILRLAATSERIVNFKARLITSII